MFYRIVINFALRFLCLFAAVIFLAKLISRQFIGLYNLIKYEGCTWTRLAYRNAWWGEGS